MSNSKTPPTGKYDGNQPGATHAPGVLCYIKVPQAEDPLIGLIDALTGVSDTGDNGKIVELVRLHYPGQRFTCRSCGASEIFMIPEPMWIVQSKSALVLSVGCDPYTGMFGAEELIPIGAPGLWIGEDTETSKPLEDSMLELSKAANQLMSLTIRRVPTTSATPATNK